MLRDFFPLMEDSGATGPLILQCDSTEAASFTRLKVFGRIFRLFTLKKIIEGEGEC